MRSWMGREVDKTETSRDAMHPAERAPEVVSLDVAKASPVSLARSGAFVATMVAVWTGSAITSRL